MLFTSIGERSVAYRDTGNPARPAVLLAHPLGMSQAVWDGVVEHLRQQLRLVSWDLPGHGASAPWHAPVTAADLADEAMALLDALGIERAHFVGTSIGGLIGQALLARAPERLGHVVLTNTGATIGTPDLWRERAARVRDEGLAAMAPELVERWFGPAFKSAAPAAAAGWQHALARGDDESYARLCELLEAGDFRGRLGDVGCPVQLVAGDADVAAPVDRLAVLAKELAGASLEIFDDIGHVPAVECPGHFAARLAAWLASAGATGAVTYDEGLAVRQNVLGAEHVARAASNATTLDAPFQDMITRMAWGELWGNPDLTQPERSLITLAVLAALGRDGELELHLDAAKRIGVAEAQLRQALMHVAVYAGVPAANHAFQLAKQHGWGRPR